MSVYPPQSYRKTAGIHRIGAAANRPAAADVLPGTLYFSADTGVLERSDGIGWTAYAGSGGSAGTAPTAVVREIPTGVIDGSNATFTLANTPIAGSEQVFLNGLLQDARGVDYSISGAVLAFLIPPLSGDRVLVTYDRI